MILGVEITSHFSARYVGFVAVMHTASVTVGLRPGGCVTKYGSRELISRSDHDRVDEAY